MKNLLLLFITLFALRADAQCILDTLITESPEFCAAGENILQINGLMDIACPGVVGECNTTMSSTVWYQINIDGNEADALLTHVIADGFDPVWSLYSGTTFENKTPIGESVEVGEPPLPCSFSDGDKSDFHKVSIIENTAMVPLTYWIAISSSSIITETAFVLRYASSLNCITCSGENSTDCGNGEFTAFVDGVETDGPFCPGTDVTVCLNFTYDASAVGNDWLHGIIPTFGSGWDIDETEIGNTNIGVDFAWFSSEGDCAPRLNGYDLPNVCTYMQDGRLQMCNVVCNPSCPCETGPGLPDGSPLPSGWFSNSGGGNNDCNADCSPASFYGVVGGVTFTADFCLPLKVKAYTDSENCQLNNDLRISIQLTSDAVSGCWSDPAPCILDPSILGPDWVVTCNEKPIVTVEDSTLCIGQSTLLEGYTFQVGDVVSANTAVVSANGNTLTAHTPGIADIIINPQGFECGPDQVITIEVFEAYDVAVQVVICEGESYEGITESGNYTFELISAEGCDSIVILELEVISTQILDESITICEGDLVTYNGVQYSEAGNYMDTLISGNCIESIFNIEINVSPSPVILFTGPDHICVGDITQLSPNTNGTWSSDDETVATITNAGLVAGVSQGTVIFTFVDNVINCSARSSILTVSLPPTVTIDQNILCLGETTFTTPNSGGQWSSSNIAIATVSDTGEVTSVDVGTCQLQFLMNGNVCPSDLIDVEVLPLDHPDCIVATENELDSKSYNLYPVPAQDILYIDGIQEQITVQVYDLEGRLLKSRYDTKSNSVDIKELVPGLYILAIRAADGSLSNKKFVKL